ncbi:MAG TPA: hypothetical protein VHM30_18135 [Gemmatimonadaceae bacterium]|nr:hypothetical protein [Gemmatimonadaceae bacterium]
MTVAAVTLRRLFAVLLPLAFAGALAHAQGGRVVEGRVMKPRGTEPDPFPVAGIVVTLHRVARSGGRPIDSTRTNSDGRYRFRYPAPTDSTAIHFVSAQYAGITYFSAPLRDPVVRGNDADLTVFDTTSRPVTVTQRGRHVVVSALDSARRRAVIEVFELSNDTSVTRIAPPRGTTWEGGIPAHASGFRVGEGDISEDAVALTEGRVRVEAPIAPGLKQLSFSYDLPDRDFPLSIPAERRTDVLEVLIEDPAGTATGAGLGEVDPVNVDGRRFRRFTARDVEPNAVFRIAIAGDSAIPRRYYIMIVALALGAAMLLVLARSTWRRGRARAPVRSEPAWANDPDALARRIAALDAEFERVPTPSDEARETYELRRADLKARLADALARRGRRE